MDPAEAAEKADDDGSGSHAHSSNTGPSRSEEKGIQQSTTVFVFWAFFLGAVGLVTALCLCFSSVFLPLDAEAEYFSMPPLARQHQARGKLLKIELGQSRQPLKVFVREEAPSSMLNGDDEECVVLLHGLGASSFMYRHIIRQMTSRGLRVIAMDFPGAGLSEKPLDRDGGFWDRLRFIYEEIAEKGLLWRFEQLFERGGFPDEQPTIMAREERRLHYDAEDLADSLDQVLNLVAIKPVHIVLHDWSVEAGLTWVAQNPTRVSSITIFDALPSNPSFPVEILRVPLLGSIVSRSSLLYHMLVRTCCVKGLSKEESESLAFLLRVNDGRETILQTWKGTNLSFDVAAQIKSLPGHPVHILWSKSAGLHWQKIGEMLAFQVVNASSSSHHGSRWPQEDAGAEVAEHIHRFISSLPPTKHTTGDEILPLHIQEIFNQMSRNKHDTHLHDQSHNACNHGHGSAQEHEHHSHSHQGHEHGTRDHGLGYMDGMGLGGWVL